MTLAQIESMVALDGQFSVKAALNKIFIFFYGDELPELSTPLIKAGAWEKVKGGHRQVIARIKR